MWTKSNILRQLRLLIGENQSDRTGERFVVRAWLSWWMLLWPSSAVKMVAVGLCGFHFLSFVGAQNDEASVPGTELEGSLWATKIAFIISCRIVLIVIVTPIVSSMRYIKTLSTISSTNLHPSPPHNSTHGAPLYIPHSGTHAGLAAITTAAALGPSARYVPVFAFQ